MSSYLTDHLTLIVVAVLAALVLALLLARPRQRVQLSDSAPLRPHMVPKGEGKGLLDEAAAATGDVAGQIFSAQIHGQLPGASGPPDELQRLKGVGPKLAEILNERGIIRFDQIAKLSPGQVEALDETLGAFRGRFARDRIVDQADYLARGDIDGYEQRFGKL